jgi:hypothetical protein
MNSVAMVRAFTAPSSIQCCVSGEAKDGAGVDFHCKVWRGCN